jgi:hypothetical protein
MYAWAYGPRYGLRPEINLPVFTAWSLRCYTDHSIAVSSLYSPLALESLLKGRLESLLDSLLWSLLEKAPLDKAALR